MAQSVNGMNDPIFLRALSGEPTPRIPVWLMRQAGRYMACYRKLREKHALLELVKNPELACEVTLQPIDAFGFDAAIIFSDILPLLECLGLKVEFTPNDGPQILNPIRTVQDIQRLTKVSAQEGMAFTLKAIGLVRKELASKHVPLIGFSGAPFTLASYAIEGGSSKDYLRTKTLMYTEPAAWNQLMAHLSDVIIDYFQEQAKAGAQVLQLFDSWVGALSAFDYQTYVLPHLIRIAQETRKQTSVPFIYFSTQTGGYLDLVKEIPATAFGVDWRMDIGTAWQTLGTERPIQGNLDPLVLCGGTPAELKRQVEAVLSSAREKKADLAGFIFNLGHGVIKQTPEDNIKGLLACVAQRT